MIASFALWWRQWRGTLSDPYKRLPRRWHYMPGDTAPGPIIIALAIVSLGFVANLVLFVGLCVYVYKTIESFVVEPETFTLTNCIFPIEVVAVLSLAIVIVYLATNGIAHVFSGYLK